MENYYEKHFLQERIRQPSGFPPPNQWLYVFGDGMEVDGLFIQSQSDEQIIASAQGIATRGRFAVGINVPVRDGDVLRRKKDGKFLRLIGDPMASPEQAETQVKAFFAEVSDRAEVQ